MKSITSIFSAMALFAALTATGCGGGGVVVPPSHPNPVPSISGMTPGFVAAGAAAQSMTITGTNFVSASTVSFNGTEHAATVVNSTQLTLTPSASDKASAACYTVAVNKSVTGRGRIELAEFRGPRSGEPDLCRRHRQ